MTNATPPRFRIESTAIRGDQARLAGSELHHLRDVARIRHGSKVGLIDEHGRNLTGRVVALDAKAALIRIDRTEEPRIVPPLILALAVIKGPRMDFAIEKAVELGVSQIWPLRCERCVVRDPGTERLARWRRLAVAAGKQSLAERPIEIEPPMDFADLATRIPAGMLPVICQSSGAPLSTVLQRASRGGILIVCGPEGDFTPQETASAQQAGFACASLGRHRLRTETAALAALVIAASALDALVQA